MNGAATKYVDGVPGVDLAELPDDEATNGGFVELKQSYASSTNGLPGVLSLPHSTRLRGSPLLSVRACRPISGSPGH